MSGEPEEGQPLPVSIIAARRIEGLGVHAVIAAGMVDENHSSVGLILTLTPCGTNISEHTLFWVGPPLTLSVQARSIWPQSSPDVRIEIPCNPRDQYFYPNAYASQWVSGLEAIRRNEVLLIGPHEDTAAVDLVKNLPWCFRIAICTTINFRQARIILQILPVSMGVLDSLMDPQSPELCMGGGPHWQW